MAKLTFTITTTAGTVTHDTETISEANMTKFRDWLWLSYPQLDVDGTPLARTAAREAQAFHDWADKLYEGTKANVLRSLRQTARETAESAVVGMP